jgi:hypothetical protein
MRTGNFEINLDTSEYDENRAYYVGNTVAKKFYSEDGSADFVSVASGSSMVYVASASALEVDDYILVVTDPKGNVVPARGVGYGKDEDRNIGIYATETGYVARLAYVGRNGEMVYAEPGTYTATVYKITNITGTDTVKFVTSRVDSYKFSVNKGLPTITFFHQKDTKDVEGVGEFKNTRDVIQAISETMTFKLNGTEFVLVDNITEGKPTGVVGTAYYKSLVKYWDWELKDGEWVYVEDYHYLPITIDEVDYKIQDDNQRAVVNTITFRVQTPAGGYFKTKVKVNRSINIAE